MRRREFLAAGAALGSLLAAPAPAAGAAGAPAIARVSAAELRRLLDAQRGKVVVLNLWATWCPPCRHEMPDLDRLQRAHADDGLVVITVSDETAEQIATLPGYSAMSLVKGRLDSTATSSPLYVGPHVARPVTHVIGRDGVLRETLLGGQTAAALEEKVAPLLKVRYPPEPLRRRS